MLLPVDDVLPALLSGLGPGKSVVLEAPPGAGKTTKVPLSVLEAGIAGPGREVLVLQPRRLAARMAAARVAAVLGQPLGGTVGYQVRFEAAAGPETRLRFITEGLLTRKLQADPLLSQVGVVVLDEFHERHLDSDLGLALVRQLQRGPRPDLAVIVMSATLDAAPVQDYLSTPETPCLRLRSEGRAYPVEVTYAGPSDEVASAVHRAFTQLLAEGCDGDVLVFLPGAREIHQVATAVAGTAARAEFDVLPLHGELPPAEQDRAVRPSARRKLILSTNVAETSVTIDGVVAVIDSGLVRLPSHDPWSGIASLRVCKISRASAVQRTGRAGRTRPGRCVRLYSRADHDRRPEFTPAEVVRADLCGVLLDLHAFGVRDPAEFPWFEAPPSAALAAAGHVLQRLGAVDRAGGLTAVGEAMRRYPVHPRLARMLVAAEASGVFDWACGAAALLSERPVRSQQSQAHTDAEADVLVDLQELEALRRGRFAEPSRLLHGPARRVLQVRDQLLRMQPDHRRPGKGAAQSSGRGSADAREDALAQREAALRRALLLGFPDRVAQARDDGAGGRTLALAGGGAARLSPASVVRTAPWLVALALEQRHELDTAGPRQPVVRSACAIATDWLIDEFVDDIETCEHLRFNPTRERVEGTAELRYHGLVLEATTMVALPTTAHAVLREAALAAGPERFMGEPGALRRLMARTAVLASVMPEFTALTEADAVATLAELCGGCTSFAELAAANLEAAVLARLGDQAAAALARLVPRHLQLAGGRRVTVEYELGQPPWVASRLQDFFGQAQGPTVAGGRVPVVLHLLAPNGRAEQVTTDLAGFWQRHYPELRRRLMRRYPRHAWPEDPLRASPPPPRPPRR